MDQLAYTNEELCLLWKLNEYYDQNPETWHNSEEILKDEKYEFKASDLRFWISHLEDNKLIEISKVRDLFVRIIYEGQLFIKQNPNKFQKYIKQSNNRDFADDTSELPPQAILKGQQFGDNEEKEQYKYDSSDITPLPEYLVYDFIVLAIKEEYIQDIINERDYHFSKAILKIEEFKDFDISPDHKITFNTENEELRLPFYEAADYLLNEYYANNKIQGDIFGRFLESIEIDKELHKFLQLIGQLVAYLDRKAYNIRQWNEYDDNRAVARSSVRQNNWVSNLIRYKKANLDSSSINSPVISNALKFLETPFDSLTILSEKHRQLISKNILEHPYSKDHFTQQVKSFFENYELPIQNEQNQYILYSVILYNKDVRINWDPNFKLKKSDLIDTIDEDGDDEESSKFDKSAFLWSDSAAETDELGRENLVKSVTDSINKLFNKHNDAYTVLLNGEWGSGKSSMLNFFKSHLKTSGWKVVKYNAWENQQFKDPWWILINAISKKATKEDYEGKIAAHWKWRFGIQYRNKVLAFVIILIFLASGAILFSQVSSDAPQKFNLTVITGLVGLVGTITSAIVGLTNNFFFKNVSHEDLKERFTEHPFDPIRKRFNQIAEKNKLDIFIDDLDRCDVNATVTLLEGIQNLFKGMPVLYIIAADGQWVSNCFNQRYKDFQNLTNDGCSIGDKFLQKTFQLTLNVPKPDPEDLKLYWNNLIGQANIPASTIEDTQDSPPKPKEVERKQAYLQTLVQRSKAKDDKLKNVKKEIEENIEHYLRKFIGLGVPDNPRQMKRFVNQYEVTRQTMVVEGTNAKYDNEDDHRVVKFLIFCMRYPTLADQLKKGEITKNEMLKEQTKDEVKRVNITLKDKSDIKELLADIDDDLIKGDFYSV